MPAAEKSRRHQRRASDCLAKVKGERTHGSVAKYGATMLKPGDKAPTFTLLNQAGEKVKLGDLKGRKVLVYFYPKP
jgi:peroxiredoxin